MFDVVAREDLGPDVTLYEIAAPKVARRHRAGQFVMIRPLATSERIPLTVADVDVARGTITLVVQAVGKTTRELIDTVHAGDTIHNVAGPLGMPTCIEVPGRPAGVRATVACVAGGIGAAPIHPIARAFKKAGHEVVTILGARNSNLLILRDRLAAASDDLRIWTDDGSGGKQGVVTQALQELIEERRAAGRDIHLVIAVGPPLMMKFVSETTRPFGVHTLVSLNTIMVDGTGMCGGCRVQVGADTKYVCVDGPEFDGHRVDFDGMMRRLAMYKKEEEESLERYRCAAEACKAQAAAAVLEEETRAPVAAERKARA